MNRNIPRRDRPASEVRTTLTTIPLGVLFYRRRSGHRGRAPVSRRSQSTMSEVTLDQFIAAHPPEYVICASGGRSGAMADRS